MCVSVSGQTHWQVVPSLKKGIYLQTQLKIAFDEIVGAHSESQLKEESLFFLLENA